jgi:WD40 repeat protein
VVCWEANSWKRRFDLSLPDDQAHYLAFSPDGATLATAGIHGAVKWIDVTRGAVVKSLDVASRSGKTLGRVQSLAFSPNGRLLAAAVGSWNRGNKWGETFLIDVQTTKVYRVPSSQEDHVVTCVAFSPDGQYLAAGGMAGVLKVWEISSGK